jgi:hypothetical protein
MLDREIARVRRLHTDGVHLGAVAANQPEIRKGRFQGQDKWTAEPDESRSLAAL